MTAPNMATIAASLERSLQNCSLNHHQQTTITNGGGGVGSSSSDGVGSGGIIHGRSSSSTSSTSDDAQQNHLSQSNDTALELNSHVSLPYHWEQCLDLKTGEIYYINWRNGMKAKEDPRRTAEYSNGDGYYSGEEDDEDSSYDSEESSTESSPSSCSREGYTQPQQVDNKEHSNNVLVVAGCKSCLMYVMVPKQLEDCPKCAGQLLHFDRSEHGSI